MAEIFANVTFDDGLLNLMQADNDVLNVLLLDVGERVFDTLVRATGDEDFYGAR
jgi:hypothetical protein